MEEKLPIKTHRASISNRRSAIFTGIVDVISFDLTEILLETELGMLHVKGKDLHVNRLSVEKGEVDIEGKLDSFVYTDSGDFNRKNESLLGRLFG